MVYIQKPWWKIEIHAGIEGYSVTSDGITGLKEIRHFSNSNAAQSEIDILFEQMNEWQLKKAADE